MIIAGLEFPDQCPEGCEGKHELIGMQGTCSRCPIFNCRPSEVGPLVKSEDFHPRVAQAYLEYFEILRAKQQSKQ